MRRSGRCCPGLSDGLAGVGGGGVPGEAGESAPDVFFRFTLAPPAGVAVLALSAGVSVVGEGNAGILGNSGPSMLGFRCTFCLSRGRCVVLGESVAIFFVGA